MIWDKGQLSELPGKTDHLLVFSFYKEGQVKPYFFYSIVHTTTVTLRNIENFTYKTRRKLGILKLKIK